MILKPSNNLLEYRNLIKKKFQNIICIFNCLHLIKTILMNIIKFDPYLNTIEILFYYKKYIFKHNK